MGSTGRNTDLDMSLDEIIRQRHSDVGMPLGNDYSNSRKKKRVSKWDRYADRNSDSEKEDDDEEDEEQEKPAEKTSRYRRRKCDQSDDDDDEPIAIPMYDAGVDEDLVDKYAGRATRSGPNNKRKRWDVEQGSSSDDERRQRSVPPRPSSKNETFVFKQVAVDPSRAVNMSLDEVIRVSKEPVPVNNVPMSQNGGLYGMKPRVEPNSFSARDPFALSQNNVTSGGRRMLVYESDGDDDGEEEPAPSNEDYCYGNSSSAASYCGNYAGAAEDSSKYTLQAIIEKSKAYFKGNGVSTGNDTGPHGYDEEYVKKKLSKYWRIRYKLFSKFDQGIRLDCESWYSVTPEDIARNIAQRCDFPNGVIVDGFCGCGGNTIQFAMTSVRQVIAIDIDPKKIEHAMHNARIYGVFDKIRFIAGDFMQIAPTLKANAVFLSPPWGGPSYLDTSEFDLKEDLPMDGYKLFETAKKISPNIAYFVPRTTKVDQLRELSDGLPVQIDENLLENRVIALTAYYGRLVKILV